MLASKLSHAPGHKAANGYEWIAFIIRKALDVVIEWPDHSPCGFIGLFDDGSIRDLYPDHIFGVGGFRHAYAIVTIFCFPVGPFNDVAVGVQTAAPYAACQMLEPVVKRRALIASIQFAPQRRRCHQSKKAD